MTPSPRLSRADEVLDFIKSYLTENGFPPSIRDIAEGVGLQSTATVHWHLTTLERRGLIIRHAGGKRMLQLVGLELCPTCGRSRAPESPESPEFTVIGGDCHDGPHEDGRAVQPLA